MRDKIGSGPGSACRLGTPRAIVNTGLHQLGKLRRQRVPLRRVLRLALRVTIVKEITNGCLKDTFNIGEYGRRFVLFKL